MNRLAARLIRTWALDAVAQANALAQIDPSWGSVVSRVADGWLVLSGPGMYVNRAMALGCNVDISRNDLDVIISCSRALRIQPAIEVTSSTRRGNLEQMAQRGFAHDTDDDVVAFVRPIPGPPVDAPTDLAIRPVASRADLDLWQQVSVAGWGHEAARARAASDAFTLAAHVTDQDGMVIAFDAVDDRPVGCASVTIRDGLATLGGMSTHPDHRRRGVQAALIEHRLRFAAERGCDLAATSAAAGGASGRNLQRHGFQPIFDIATWKLKDRPTT